MRIMKIIVFIISLFIAALCSVFMAKAGQDYKIGDRGPAGGWIFFDKGEYSNGWRYLEAAPNDQSNSASWAPYDERQKFDKLIVPGADGIKIGTGKFNTMAITRKIKDQNCAAWICKNLKLGGYSDWFLPSKDELNLMFVNLHKKGIGGFATQKGVGNGYWSSTQGSYTWCRNCAWCQFFSFGESNKHDGFKREEYKHYNFSVRAIRAF